MSVKLVFVIVSAVVTLHFVCAGPALKNNYIEQENSCREVCGHCDCDGFYCEDECICECSIKDEENLQCIADMKTECDKNGLEYELLMQESTKERFMRQINSNAFNQFSHLGKNFVIMKQKREESAVSPSEEPIVAAPAPKEQPLVVQPEHLQDDDPKVAAPAPETEKAADGESRLGVALAGLKTKALIAGEKFAITGLRDLKPGKLLMSLRGRTAAAPSLPSLPTLQPFTFKPTAAPFSLDSLIVQPRFTLS